MPSILKLADPPVPVETATTALRLARPARVAALFSGGKDSTYAAYVASQRGWDVTHLLSILPQDRDSMLFHTPNLHMTPIQAEAMGLPLVQESAQSGEQDELAALS